MENFDELKLFNTSLYNNLHHKKVVENRKKIIEIDNIIDRNINKSKYDKEIIINSSNKSSVR